MPTSSLHLAKLREAGILILGSFTTIIDNSFYQGFGNCINSSPSDLNAVEVGINSTGLQRFLYPSVSGTLISSIYTDFYIRGKLSTIKRCWLFWFWKETTLFSHALIIPNPP